MLKLTKPTFKKLISFSLLPLSILSLTSFLLKTPQHPNSNPNLDKNQVSNFLSTQEKSENKINRLNHNKIDVNAVNWMWKASYQEVKTYTEDFSLSEIRTGYTLNGEYFSYIKVKFENENNYKEIYFDTDDAKSLQNVISFSEYLVNHGKVFHKTLFGKDYIEVDLDIKDDTTFRFQTNDRNNKFNNITPIMFGKGYNHDPSYYGRIQHKTVNGQRYLRFLDVAKQRNDNIGFDGQQRDAFSQNPNTWYKLTTGVYGRNGEYYAAPNSNKLWHGKVYFNDDSSPCTHFVGSDVAHQPNHFGIDIWFIKGVWYVGIFFNH